MTADVQKPPAAPPEPTATRAVLEHAKSYWAEVRSGEVGALPAVAGIIALCVFFGLSRPVFLSVGNLANLFGQGAAVACIAMGLVFVLILGEIDLSAGFASGVCASVMAVILTDWGMPWPLAIGAAIATGVVIGLLLGTLVVKLGIPSFVVTLAAFLAFQGIVLMILDEGSNISINNETVKTIAGGNLERWQGWALLVLTVAAYAAIQLQRWRRRVARSLVHEPLAVVVARVTALAALLTATVFLLNLERSANPQIISLTGVPVVVALLGALFAVWTFVLHRTRFGRHLYAVGGNAEAAVRAGVNVDRVRIAAFVICSGMAAVGGVVAASRAASVDPNTGGSNVLLLSVGAAVIGGASLFGGKGTVRAALLGGAVVAIINNGMGLMGLSAGVRFGVTGAVLLLAAGVDAMSRGRGKLFGRH
ncbi:sugar ABC transporter permease [Glycomyces harbinensis]|uniref:Xylose transport system permease protein XylH n=1 Tax=Glycomyces harbinensis TaxID=58114 RepID=A0A1G6TWV3_9ACTN|nr:ABC transporter permease [Glycomyces harbinensis]SDD32775.1 D-xylose transport system permease protein [Glycomyces harbinensis]